MKKLLFLAWSLSILLLASCSNDIQKEGYKNSLYPFPTNGKETFVVIQNQTLKDFERILKTETTYKEIVAKYIKDKKAQGKTVIIPRDHKDYKIDMNALKTYNSNPFKKVMNKKSGSWEVNFQITKDGILQDKKLYDLDKNFSPDDYDPIKKTFYSEVSPGVTGTDYTEDCELYAVGDYCYVWYKNEPNKSMYILPEDCRILAEKFDDIYKQETYIFGSNIPEFKDEAKELLEDAFITVDPNKTKIHIIVYDLNNDFDKESNAVLMGYFWPLDFFKNEYLAEIKDLKSSNECECIHIDSQMLYTRIEDIYSTLGHEFQHLLHFVNKSLNTYDGGFIMQKSSTWFNELMSMVCEDIMLEQLGISPEAGPQNRLDLFCETFNSGFETWLDTDYVLISYANTYAFGAFLLRNWGIDCIRAIALNEYIDEKAIIEAVKTRDESINNFTQLQELFYEVMLYPTSSTKHTLNKSVSETYTIRGEEVKFNCNAINLNDYIIYSSDDMNSDMAELLYGGKSSTSYKGPVLFNECFVNNINNGTEYIGPRGTLIIHYDADKEYIEIPNNWSDKLKFIPVQLEQ
ncbi:Peptidase M30 [Treponema bryantii]|uniref:Peptidase M30 n=1 Tax=Treponema bryantii TaxID=163 RepID=A0A1H9J6T7_9SPIR|nr:hypothetical protein [Treponema bryantii]SEQ82580.1 Peptidase M30 [Treponema bryantii]